VDTQRLLKLTRYKNKMITLDTLPSFLKDSKTFYDLSELFERDEPLTNIPDIVLKEDMSINSFDDIIKLINIMTFWGLDMSEEFVKNFISYKQKYHQENPKSPCINSLVKSHFDGTGIDELLFAIQDNTCGKQSMKHELSIGCLDCVKYIRSKGKSWENMMYYEAIKQGNLEAVKYLIKNKCPVDYNRNTINFDFFNEALYKGHNDIIEYLLSHGRNLSHEIVKYLIKQNKFDDLKLLIKLGFIKLLEKNKAMKYATKYNKFNIFQLLNKHGIKYKQYISESESDFEDDFY
jgi:hypothetical protein